MTRTKTQARPARAKFDTRAPILLIASGLLIALACALKFSGTWAAALTFAFWIICVVAWGRLLCRALGFENALRDAGGATASLALGSAAAALAMTALGELGLIGSSAAWPLRLLLLAGPAVDAWLGTARPHREPAARAEKGTERFIVPATLGALLVMLVLMALAAATPQGHPDPLYYNLLGPRLWFQAGAIRVPSTMPILYQCSYWETLLLWGQCLLGGPGAAGLLEAQLFGQWLHVVVGVGGCILALRLLFEPYARSRSWLWLGVLGAAASASMTWTAWTAKNDWGASFWMLSGFALAATAKGSGPRTLAAGALVGLALAAKLTTIYAAIPLLALPLIVDGFDGVEGGDGADAVLFFVGLFIPLAALFLRNALGTGNPFFPTMDRMFPSDLLTNTWRSYLKRFEGTGPDFDAVLWWARIKLLFAQTPLVLAVLGPPLVWLRARGSSPKSWQQSARLLPLWLTAVASLLLFLLLAGPAASLRLLGPGVLLLGGVTVLSVEEILLAAGASGAWRAGAATAVLALSVVFGGFPWPAAVGPYSSYAQVGEEARTWLRSHATERDAILLPDDNRLYGLVPLNARSVAEDPSLQMLFTRLHTLDEQLAALKRLNIRYVLLMATWKDTKPSRLLTQLAALGERQPRLVAYSSTDATILDLHQLVE